MFTRILQRTHGDSESREAKKKKLMLIMVSALSDLHSPQSKTAQITKADFDHTIHQNELTLSEQDYTLVIEILDAFFRKGYYILEETSENVTLAADSENAMPENMTPELWAQWKHHVCLYSGVPAQNRSAESFKRTWKITFNQKTKEDIARQLNEAHTPTLLNHDLYNEHPYNNDNMMPYIDLYGDQAIVPNTGM